MRPIQKKSDTLISSKPTASNMRGFTLIELLVSMVIFLIVTGAVFGLMRAAQQGRTVVNEQAPLNKSVRIGLNILGRDAYNAGYGYPLENAVILPELRVSTLLETPPDTDLTRDNIPPIFAGNDLHTNSLNPNPLALTDQVTFLASDPTFNLTGVAGKEVPMPLRINAATTADGIDEIVPIVGGNGECNINDLYLVTGNTGSTLAVATGLGTDSVQFSNGDILDFNQTGTSGTLMKITTPASMQRVLMVTYFVTNEGVLTRRQYANSPPPAPSAAFVDEPLVYGVEDFQIEYVMDNGTITNNPEIQRLVAVRQIRFTISARGNENLTRGNANSVGNDQPHRVTMTSTFSTRNLGYDAN
jgi:prepilin-type N-terminal cleavage/methylation domain-containing protein